MNDTKEIDTKVVLELPERTIDFYEVLHLGKAVYQSKNYEFAFACFTKLAEQDSDLVKKAWGCMYLAKMYYFGYGVEKNPGKLYDFCAEVATLANGNVIMEELCEVVRELNTTKAVDVIDGKDKFRNTLLHIAAQEGLEEVAMLLLEKGDNINGIDYQFWTPLHYCVD